MKAKTRVRGSSKLSRGVRTRRAMVSCELMRGGTDNGVWNVCVEVTYAARLDKQDPQRSCLGVQPMGSYDHMQPRLLAAQCAQL
jgi:hypothetical protein